jgi:hypothetical protein
MAYDEVLRASVNCNIENAIRVAGGEGRKKSADSDEATMLRDQQLVSRKAKHRRQFQAECKQ